MRLVSVCRKLVYSWRACSVDGSLVGNWSFVDGLLVSYRGLVDYRSGIFVDNRHGFVYNWCFVSHWCLVHNWVGSVAVVVYWGAVVNGRTVSWCMMYWGLNRVNFNVSRILACGSWLVGLYPGAESMFISNVFNGPVDTVSISVSIGTFLGSTSIAVFLPELLVTISILCFIAKTIWLRFMVL